MWVSRRTDYATRAILALSLEGGGPLKLEELARRTAVPHRCQKTKPIAASKVRGARKCVPLKVDKKL